MSDEWPQEVRDLAEIIGLERIRRYERYIDNRDKLADYEGLSLIAGAGSVLLDTDIDHLCSESRSLPLIDPLDDRSLLGSASYHLRLGSKYRVGDDDGYLSEDNRVLEIPRHGIAIVSTHEWLNIPGFLIARWNLKVKKVYRGLVWVGSLQVDPGYQGFLFCPLYNLSNQTQQLTYKEPLFTIDFVVTKEYEAESRRLWDLPGKYSTFDFARLDVKRIKSAPQVELAEQWKEIRRINQQTDRAIQDSRRFQNLVLTALTIIITAIAVITTLGATAIKWDASWILSVFASVLAVIAVVLVTRRTKK